MNTRNRKRTISWGRRARRALTIAAAPVIAAGLLTVHLAGPANAAQQRYQRHRECNPSKQGCRPECLTARITIPAASSWADSRPAAPSPAGHGHTSPAVMYLEFCGTGSGGETPLREARWAHALTLDGGRVITAASCTRRSPCVLLAPDSPQS